MADLFTKKKMNEEQVKFEKITPAIIDKAGWPKELVRMEYYYTDGEVIYHGDMRTRKKGKKVDYLLLTEENYPIAIVEAKGEKHSHVDGLQQGIDYANTILRQNKETEKELLKKGEMLEVPFVFSTNGEKFRMYSKCIKGLQKDLCMDEFPTLGELKSLYNEYKNISSEEAKIIEQPYYTSVECYPPRYYQRIAINKTVEAIAKGINRILLVMATGTGKTYTAFQIVWRLFKSGAKKKILYLADRNVLIDQTIRNDFKPLANYISKVKGKTPDSNFDILMSLYGQWVKNDKELKAGEKQPYESWNRDAFDLIIIDECHRSSRDENSQWHKILEYFDSATQIGMTATPKDDKDGSNIDYFGEPLYTYSLTNGIQDGFLAPYKVVRSHLNIDLSGYIAEEDEKDLYGQELVAKRYTRNTFGKEININKRQLVIGKRITEMLREIGDMTKTIVFCTDEQEAAIMRDILIAFNEEKYKRNNKYVVRITSSDKVGKSLLDDFIDPFSDYPVIATTSMLLSTGVDCKTCGFIVIDKEVGNMTTFKQMVGRGTRLYEPTGKQSFVILDFRDVTNIFYDPNFDGIVDTEEYHSKKDDEQQKSCSSKEQTKEDERKKYKYFVEGDDVGIVIEQEAYIGENGKPVTMKVVDLTKKGLLDKFRTLDVFKGAWAAADRKKAILDELKESNIIIDAVKREVPRYQTMDEFDIICDLAFGVQPMTRRERIENIKKRDCFAKYGDEAKKVIYALLDQYANAGISDIESTDVLEIGNLSQFGRKAKIIRLFNGKKGYEEAISEIENEIYSNSI